MIKRHKSFKRQQQFYRINERIGSLQLRVLDSEGKQIGVLSKYEALQSARSQGLDLVEVAPNAKPPVARIVDFKKFLYQQGKKKREEKKNAKLSETKEIRLSPFIEEHDREVRIRKARGFLENNDKVRFVLKFKGRQIIHPEFGQEVIKGVIQSLSGISKIEREPHFEGKQLIALIVPDKKSSRARSASGEKEEGETDENKEISIKTV